MPKAKSAEVIDLSEDEDGELFVDGVVKRGYGLGHVPRATSPNARQSNTSNSVSDIFPLCNPSANSRKSGVQTYTTTGVQTENSSMTVAQHAYAEALVCNLIDRLSSSS